MSDGTVKVRQSPVGDRPIDNEAITTGSGDVYRQRIQVCGALLTEIARVLSGEPAADAFGLVVRAVGAAKESTLADALVALEAIRAAVETSVEVTVSGTVTVTQGPGGGAAWPVRQVAQLVPSEFDHITLGYTSGKLTSAVYRTGGAAGTVVATLTLGYSGSDLVTVERT